MKKKVVFILLQVEENEYPLVPAYLSGYAQLDPEIKEIWNFEAIINPYTTSSSKLLSDMSKVNADVFAFSCYVWNMGLIKQTVYNYLKERPDTNIILGGPQVAHQAQKYLDKEYENVVICNGEGEKTFRNYLKELMQKKPDFNQVRGLSFYKNHSLIKTLDEERFENLDEIPSPFSNELFNKGTYGGVNLETSRGCPFQCTYCHWGALKCQPAKFSDERVMSDISWIAQRGISYLHFLDANFGFFKRDLELARFIVKCKKEYNAPNNVLFPTYRKKCERVFNICETLHDAEVSISCNLPFQSLNETTIDLIGRKSNDTENLILLLNQLNKKGIDSYSELIWPLPGETLESLQKGIAKLCEVKNNFFANYTLLLMNNILLQSQREAYGLVTECAQDINGEAEVVVQTKDVTYNDFVSGVKFVFATNVLYNLRGLYITSRYLHFSGLEKYNELFSTFASYVTFHTDMLGFAVMKAIAEEKKINQHLLGSLIHEICHKQRDLFDMQLFQFVSSQAWWNDKNAQLYFELDLINRGYMYSGQVKEKMYTFNHIKVLDILPDAYVIEVPSSLTDSLKETLGVKAAFRHTSGSNENKPKICLKVNHKQSQKAFDESESYKQQVDYCHFINHFPSKYLPTWEDHDYQVA